MVIRVYLCLTKTCVWETKKLAAHPCIIPSACSYLYISTQIYPYKTASPLFSLSFVGSFSHYCYSYCRRRAYLLRWKFDFGLLQDLRTWSTIHVFSFPFAFISVVTVLQAFLTPVSTCVLFPEDDTEITTDTLYLISYLRPFTRQVDSCLRTLYCCRRKRHYASYYSGLDSK